MPVKGRRETATCTQFKWLAIASTACPMFFVGLSRRLSRLALAADEPCEGLVTAPGRRRPDNEATLLLEAEGGLEPHRCGGGWLRL
jgi:hypothetical protein